MKKARSESEPVTVELSELGAVSYDDEDEEQKRRKYGSIKTNYHSRDLDPTPPLTALAKGIPAWVLFAAVGGLGGFVLALAFLYTVRNIGNEKTVKESSNEAPAHQNPPVDNTNQFLEQILNREQKPEQTELGGDVTQCNHPSNNPRSLSATTSQHSREDTQ